MDGGVKNGSMFRSLSSVKDDVASNKTTVFALHKIVLRLNSDSNFTLLHISIKVSDEPFTESLALNGGVKIDSMFKSLSSVIADVASN